MSINHFFRTPAIAGVLFLLAYMPVRVSAQGIVQNDVQHSVKIFDENGKSFVNPYIDVNGNPFFSEDWKYGKIRVADNSVFEHIQLRLDLLSQEVHFLKSDKVEMVAPQGMIREITLYDSNANTPQTYTFQCGFPAVDNQNGSNFYLVLSDGKIKFLKSIRKIIHQEKNEYTGESQKEFREYEDYYFYFQDKMQRIKRDKAYILDFMKDKNDKVEAFLKANKISFKSMDDIKVLVAFYNSL